MNHRVRRQLNKARSELDRFPSALTRLIARIAIAAVFYQTGMAKLANWAVTIELFAGDYRVPLLPSHVAAVLGTTTELAGAAALVLGLGTRVAAGVLLALVLVIQVFVYPENWSDHLVWGTMLAYIATRGPGTISLDHLIVRYWLDRE